MDLDNKIDHLYQHVQEEIQQGRRGLIQLHSTQILVLCEFLQYYLETITSGPFELSDQDVTKREKSLIKVLCLVEHSAKPIPSFAPLLLNLLKMKISDEALIFILNCTRKHIIDAQIQQGKRLEYSFLEVMKKLLYHQNPEVIEWTLRLIEGCGAQGIYFLKDLDQIKPPPWKWFNSHQRSIREIIALLQHRWSPSSHERKN